MHLEEQNDLLKHQIHEMSQDIDNYLDEINTLKKQIEEWKELFFLLKSDHELQENWQTNEWMVKAREMGIDV